MKKIEVEAFSEAVNSPVLKLPYRKFPGVLIQGDSLSILYNLAASIYQECQKLAPENDSEEDGLADYSKELKDLLAGYLAIYEATLQQNGIDLPYKQSMIIDL